MTDPAEIARFLADAENSGLCTVLDIVANGGRRFEYKYSAVKTLERLGLISVSMFRNQHLWCDASITPLGVAVREIIKYSSD